MLEGECRAIYSLWDAEVSEAEWHAGFNGWVLMSVLPELSSDVGLAEMRCNCIDKDNILCSHCSINPWLLK